MEILEYLAIMEEESTFQSCGREHPALAGGGGTTKAFFIDNLLRWGQCLNQWAFCLLSHKYTLGHQLSCTGFAFRFEHRKWNRVRNRLPKLVQTIGPSVPFPVFKSEGEPGTIIIYTYVLTENKTKRAKAKR